MKMINKTFETCYCCNKNFLKKKCSESSFDNKYDRVDVTWPTSIRVSISDLTFRVQFLVYLSGFSRCFRNISLDFYISVFQKKKNQDSQNDSKISSKLDKYQAFDRAFTFPLRYSTSCDVDSLRQTGGSLFSQVTLVRTEYCDATRDRVMLHYYDPPISSLCKHSLQSFSIFHISLTSPYASDRTLSPPFFPKHIWCWCWNKDWSLYSLLTK